MNSKWFGFDPHKSFLSLFVLWFFVGLFLLIAISAWIVILKFSDINFEFSYTGFNGFVDIFRVPLGILALIIPIVMLLAANHRSEQTKEQLKLTQAQNNFSNYYKHMEEFEKYIKHVDGNNAIKKPRQLYAKLFKESINGNFSVSQEITQELRNLIDIIGELSGKFNSKDVNIWGAALSEVDVSINSIASLFYIAIPKNPTSIRIFFSNGSVAISVKGIQHHLKEIFYVFILTDHILRFEPSYQTGSELSLLLQMYANIERIPENKFRDNSEYRPFELLKKLGIPPEESLSVQ